MTEEVQEWPNDFDHHNAYEAGQEMGDAIKKVMDIANEHGCPIQINACISNNEESYQLFSTHNKRGNFFPKNFILAEILMQMSGGDLHVIEFILNRFFAANATDERVMQMAQQMTVDAAGEVTNLLRESTSAN